MTPEAADGTIQVPIRLDASQLGGCSCVAFERISLNGVIVATHEDITDKAQTVRVVHIGTMATDAADGDKYLNDIDGMVTIEFKFNLKDAKQYDGRKVVAFEECSESGRHVAAHADVHDENQIVTLHVPAPIMQTGDSMTAVGVATIGVAVIAGIAITIRRRMTK